MNIKKTIFILTVVPYLNSAAHGQTLPSEQQKKSTAAASGQRQHESPESYRNTAEDYDDNEEWNKAFLCYQKGAAAGDPYCQVGLGQYYLFGHGGADKDEMKAHQLFEKALPAIRSAAEKGNVHAEFIMGKIYHYGLGVDANITEAGKWFTKAADKGDAAAQSWLAVYYLQGAPYPADQDKGMSLFHRAADQGYLPAFEQLANSYRGSKNADSSQEFVWQKKAALKGFAPSQFLLGRAYSDGSGGAPLDLRQAAYWYKQAAESGHERAQIFLAYAFRFGKGVPQDDAQALSWFERAGNGGSLEGQLMTGLFYQNGIGAKQDLQKARYWFNIPCGRGFQAGCDALKSLPK